MKVTVNHEGIIFEVDGQYTPGTKDTYLQPGDPEIFEIEAIYIGDQDVTDFLTGEQYSGVQVAALEIASEEAASEPDRLEYEYEQWKESRLTNR